MNFLISGQKNESTQTDEFIKRSAKVTSLIINVNALKSRQDEMDVKFDILQLENEALWRNIVGMREKAKISRKLLTN